MFSTVTIANATKLPDCILSFIVKIALTTFWIQTETYVKIYDLLVVYFNELCITVVLEIAVRYQTLLCMFVFDLIGLNVHT